MLPKFEFGHLYKFAVSLGLIMVALGLALPWLVLRDDGPLLITSAELDRLTPVAQAVMREKQAHYRFVIDNYRYASIVLCGAGIAIGGFGLVKWADRQRVANELEDTQRDTAKAQFQQLSPEEAEEKLEREAEELLAEEALEPVQPEPAASTPSGSVARGREMNDVRESLSRVERSVTDALTRALGSTHDVKRDVRVHVQTGARFEIDAVALGRTASSLSLAVEIKYVRSHAQTIRVRLADATSRAARAAHAMRSIAPGPVAGLVLFVVEEPLEERFRDALPRWVRDVTEVLAVPVAVVAFSRDQIEQLPGDHVRLAIEAEFGGL